MDAESCLGRQAGLAEPEGRELHAQPRCGYCSRAVTSVSAGSFAKMIMTCLCAGVDGAETLKIVLNVTPVSFELSVTGMFLSIIVFVTVVMAVNSTFQAASFERMMTTLRRQVKLRDEQDFCSSSPKNDVRSSAPASSSGTQKPATFNIFTDDDPEEEAPEPHDDPKEEAPDDDPKQEAPESHDDPEEEEAPLDCIRNPHGYHLLRNRTVVHSDINCEGLKKSERRHVLKRKFCTRCCPAPDQLRSRTCKLFVNHLCSKVVPDQLPKGDLHFSPHCRVLKGEHDITGASQERIKCGFCWDPEGPPFLDEAIRDEAIKRPGPPDVKSAEQGPEEVVSRESTWYDAYDDVGAEFFEAMKRMSCGPAAADPPPGAPRMRRVLYGPTGCRLTPPPDE